MKRILLSLGGVALSLLIAAPAVAATVQQNSKVVQPKKMIIKSSAISTGGGTDSTTENKAGGKGKTPQCIEGAGCIVNECTTGTCKSGECVRWKPDNSKCNDKNECTKDICNEKQGCLHTNLAEGTSCAADKNACTIDKCNRQGECKTVETTKCDDGKFCTIDTCDKAEGKCKFTKNPDQGCCEPGTTDKAGKDDACKVGITCTQEGKWPEPNWKSTDNATCDRDSSQCTADKCQSGQCTAGARKDCADSLFCTTDSCDDATGQCQNTTRTGCVCEPGKTKTEGSGQCAVTLTCTANGAWPPNNWSSNGTSCEDTDQNVCTVATCSGGGCNQNGQIKTACNPTLDGCCPSGCNTSANNLDPDCPASCGNGVREGGEKCDGSSIATCGPNQYGLSATSCDTSLCTCIYPPGVCTNGEVQPPPQGSTNPCDVGSVCTNGQWVREDYSTNSNTVCRPAVGVCDVEEKCDGMQACPADELSPAGEVCRLATAGDPCDLPETCDGASAACPQEDLRRRDYTFDQQLTARPLAEAATGIEAPAQTLTNYRTLSDYRMFNIVPQDTISPTTLSQFSLSTTTRQTSAPRLSVIAPITAELIAQAIARANDRCTIRSCNASGEHSETPLGCVEGDGICCDGCNATTDDDCTADCGNGVVEAGEDCEISISPGAPGSCSLFSCDDQNPATIDSVSNAGSCNPTCTRVNDTSRCYILKDGTYTSVASGTPNGQNPCQFCDPIANPTGWTPRPAGTTVGTPTTCHTADSCDTTGNLVAGGWVPPTADGRCCTPPGGATDPDCALCGNGILDTGETCDTAISLMPFPGSPPTRGVCPTTSSCEGRNPTTTDTLRLDGTCQAYCSHEVERCYITETSPLSRYGYSFTPSYSAEGPATTSGQTYNSGQVNPNNPCEYCDLASPTSWSPVQDNTPCGGDPCAPRHCSQGTCGAPEVKVCADDECHKGGACEKETGICVYAETTECPAPETAVCDGAKLDPGEFCDGAFGCGADQTCAECKKCIDIEKPTTTAAAPSVTPKCSVLGASPEVAKRNEELVAAGIDNVCFCESETSTCCMVFAVSQPKGTTAATASAAAGAWQLVQLSGRTFEPGVPSPKGIPAPVAIFKSAAATDDPLAGLSTGIPGATLDRIGDDHVVINNMLSYAKVPIGPQGGGEFAPPTSKEVLKVTSSASASPAMQTTGETVCFVAPLQPTWLQADGAGGEDSNWDMSKMSERIKQAQTTKKAAGVAASAAPSDLGNTGGIWNPYDVYQFSFSLAGAGAQVAPNIEGSKAATAGATAASSAGVTILATPGYGPGHADKPGCGLMNDATAPSASGVFLVIVGALLLVPVGALVAVRVRGRRRK